MEKKKWAKSLVLASLTASLVLTGYAFAQNKEFRQIDQLEQVDSLLVDKRLGASSNYDLRVYQYITADKSYGNTNENWALVANRLLEFNPTGMGGEYSMRHMDYSTAINSTSEGTPNPHYRNLGSGGNIPVGLGYLTSGRGPVMETEMPFQNNLNKISLNDLQKSRASIKVEDYTKFKNVYKYQNNGITYAWDKNTTYYTPSEIIQNREAIKEHIVKYGAVSANIYRDDNYMRYRRYGDENYVRDYDSYSYRYWYYYREVSPINPGPIYYCNNPSVTPNHEVVLIGWDDNYTNEYTGSPQKGAYIALDADVFYRKWNNEQRKRYYDSDWRDVGKDISISTHFYYISYDDFYVESNVYGIGQLGYVDYDHIYQYDNLGLSTSITGQYYGSEVYGANVFTRNEKYAQRLNEVTVANTEDMQYEVYVNPKDVDLTQDKLIKVATTGTLKAGYHTIKINDDIMLTGNRFAVVVKYISPTDISSVQRKEARIGVQSPTEQYYEINGSSATLKTRDIAYWQNASSAPMRSYISDTGDNWTDLYDNQATQRDAICIKALVSNYPSYTPPIEKVDINKTELTLIKGDAETLTASVTPTDAKDTKVYWTSANRNIATVNNEGKVTGIAGGETTIYARSADATVYAECKVKVDVPVTNLVLNKQQVTMLQNETHILVPIVSPDDATNKVVQWSSSNKEVVQITDNGVLIGLKQGRAVVTALIRDDYGTHTATCTVVLPESLLVDVNEVRLNKHSLTMQKGTRETLQATIYPADATNKTMVWTSSNKNVAIVNANGRITALSAGKTTITVTSVSGGETDSCEVTVTAPEEVAVKGVSITPSQLQMDKGESKTLTANINPSNSSNKNVTWTSSNENVAVVNSGGRVTAIGVGKTTITARTVDGGYTATCEINVSKANTKVTGVRLNKTGMTLNAGETSQVRAEVLPYDATNQKVTWSSNAKEIADVDQEGNITCKSAGKATITAKTEDGNYTATCVVTVKVNVPVQGVTLDRNTVEMKKDRTVNLKATITPNDATNQTISWTSKDEEVAVVYDGKIHSLKAGKTTITATTEDGKFTANCEVTVTEDTTEGDLTFESKNNQYDINDDQKTIGNVNSGTKVSDIKNGTTTNGTITITDKDGKDLSDSDKVGTGSKVTITKDDKKEEYTIVIPGDINGDGEVTTTDLQQLIDQILGKSTGDKFTNLAGDFDGDGALTISDVSILRKKLLGYDI